jgi:PAS domain S-box-containing protein
MSSGAKEMKADKLSDTAEQVQFIAGLIKYVSQPIIVTSDDKRLLYWNAAFSKLTGYNKKELSDQIISAGLTAPEWHESETKALEKLQHTGKSQTFQKEYICKDGTRVPVEVLIYQLSEDNGKERYYIALVTDITERKRLEEELQKSEKHYRVLVENAIEGIVVIQDGKIKFVNPIVTLVTGYSAEELLSMSLNDFLCPDNEKTAVESVTKAAVPGSLSVVPLLKVRTKDHGIRLIESTVVPIIWDDKPANLNLLRDITDRYQSEETLRQSEKKYRSILDDISEGYWEVDLAGNFTSYNDAICRILGYSENEMAGTNYEAYTSPKDADKVYKAFNKVYRTGKPIRNMHYEIARKDGSKRFAETSVFPRRNDKGKVIGFRGVSHDITERSQLEGYLEKERQEFKLIIDSAPILVFYKDKNGKIIRANKAFAEALRMPEEELFGKTVFDIYSAEIAQAMTDDDQEVFKSGRPKLNIIEQYESADGSRWVQTDKVPIFDKDGLVIGLVGFAQDITERRQIEETLRQSEERYRTILEDIQESYFEIDIAGNFTFCNDAMRRSLGYSKGELIGMNYKVFTPPDEVKKLFEIYNRMYRKVEPKASYQTEQIKKDGTRVSVEYSAVPIRNENGEITGFRGIGRDITERIRIEEALRQSEERYRTIMDETHDDYFEVDLAGNYIFVNDAWCLSVGYTLEELLGKSYKLTTPGDDAKKFYAAFHQIYLTGQPIKSMSIKFVRKDGSTGDAEMSAFPMRNEKGDIIGFRGVSHDVTERKQMEDALRQSEEKYRTILEDMEESYYEEDLAGNFAVVNNKLCRDLGYSKEELIGMNYRTYVPPEEIERVRQTYNQVYRTGKPIALFSTQEIRKDRSRTVSEISIAPLRNQKGEIIGFRGVGRDITKRVQMEEALRRSEERYRTLLEEMEEPYFEVDLAGNYTFFNDALCHKLGYSREELEHITYKDYTAPDDIDKVFEAYNQVYRTGMPLKWFPSDQITKDGARLPAETSVFPLKNKEGKIIGFRGVSRDITERKQAQEEYQTIIQIAMDGFWLTDLEGHFLDVNEAYCKLIGYSRDELLSMSIADVEAAEKPEDVLKHIQKIKEVGSDRFETRQRRKDGEIIDVDISVTYLPVHGGRLFQAIRDITQRKRAEEARKLLEQKAQLASRLASVGELASGVAHEINNPLTGVIGYAHLLLSRKDISRDVRHDLEIINEGSQRVAGIVKKLLAFARQTKPEQRYVNINELVRNTLELRAYELSASNIRVTLQLTRDMPMTIADPGQLQQVFLNLIINAETEMKLAHDKGKLSIKTERMNNTLRITFKDTGPGIAKENLETIFDPFFTTREVGQGTGLGLSVCHGIITEHNGRIWAESQPGKGAAFIIELPLVTEEGQYEPTEPVIEETARVAKAKILVVDDEPVIRQLISKVLGEQGHTVETIDNAASALKMVKSKRYRLILLDIKMPGMSGVELYKQFQKIAPSLTKRVVFITGDVMGKRTIAFLDKTKTPYIMKPFDARELKTQVNRILAKR